MSLYSNAVRSITVGVEDMQSSDVGRVISGLRNIHAGILLLIKEKLVRLSPADSDEVLIKSSVLPILKQSGELAFIGKGKKTVDIYAMQERCKSLGIIVDWRRIRDIANIRNDAEHRFTSMTSGAIQSTLAKALVVVRDLLTLHLNEEPVAALGHDTWQFLLSNAEIYNKERDECLQELRAIEWNSKFLASAIEEVSCDTCYSDLFSPVDPAVDLDDMRFACRSCGVSITFPEFASSALDYLRPVRQYYRGDPDDYDPEDAIVECPHCFEFGYVFSEGKCIICSESASQECSRCCDTILPEEISSSDMCGYCRHMWDKMADE